MFIHFDNLSSKARIWIYQAEREFTPSEKAFVESGLKAFVDSWTSHENVVNGSFQIFHNQFIVIASDEGTNDVSGCSIDKSVHLISSLGHQLGLNLMDRKIAYKDAQGVKTVDLKTFKELIADETIDLNTLVFNNAIDTKIKLETEWLVVIEKSWASRYFLIRN